MHRIMFVCHGNICRSVMAEMIMKDIIRKNNTEDMFEIASLATSREEIGNDIYPPAKRILEKYNVPYEKHRAMQISIDDYEYYDYVICMDNNNIRNLFRIIGSDYENKVYRLLDFTKYKGMDIEDPWYTDNYDKVYNEILEGCTELYADIID